jgi:rhomboid protease GluP
MFSIFSRTGDWRTFYRTSPVTSIIIIVNTVFLLLTIVTGGFSFSSSHLRAIGAITRYDVLELNEWWRLVSAAFLHGGILHFLGNVVIGLLTLSSALERLIGSKKFAFIYFGSMVISGLAVVLFSPDNAVTIGASGAIFGVLGSLLYYTVYKRENLTYQDVQSVRTLSIINIVFTLLMPGISMSGHIGGIIAGFLLSYLVIKRDVFEVMH